MKRRIRITGLVLALIMAAALLTGCGKKAATVTVGSKQFTESILLGEMFAQLMEAHTELEVERKLNLGGTSVCFPALEKGEIDMYAEYSGTAYGELLKLGGSGGIPAAEVYDIAKNGLADRGLTLFDPIGLNNAYAVGMVKAKADELGIVSMSDVIPHAPNLKFGGNHLFYERESDGYSSMAETYSYDFAAAEKMDSSLLYDAVGQEQLDIICVYATDSLLVKYKMVVLQDDLSFFPAYHGAPLVRDQVLEENPELKEVLNMLSGRIDDAAMQQLNYQVDIENKDPADVAKAFLTEQGLI